METENIREAIKHGAPIYNQGNHSECLRIYLETAIELQQDLNGAESILDAAIVEAAALQSEKKYSDGAWVMRHCFDDVLDRESDMRRISAATLPDGFDRDSDSGWQDEKEPARDDLELGQSLADTAHIVKSFIRPSTHRWVSKSYDNTFEGQEAVDVLTSLSLSPSRKLAAEKLTMMKRCGLIVSVSHAGESKFRDGSRLYRYASREQMQASLVEVMASDKVSIDGSDDHIMMAALSAALEDPEYSPDTNEATLFAGVNARRLSEISTTLLSEKQHKGQQLAEFCAQIESIIGIADHTYHLRTYEQCFVGKDAVTELVKSGIVSTRSDAVKQLNELSEVGLIQHVTQEHHFKDDTYYYRFTSAKDVQRALDAFSTLSRSARGEGLVQYSALINRFKHIAGSLNITNILNDFYGCEDESGWDMSDLENWRTNMKRWGFGRREDQDDGMVNRLSPLLQNIDPETWDVTGDPEWESPYGILAQIALFDQVSRSAFRGTPNAFKWDELAKRATRVAIENGYFDTAYKSTLNQFVILLPLEHSEDWEDQKLGVSLLLSLLSSVAVMDEGLSDYEIIKRLEFSKRLTTAFLEHAQVIAKFKRYPHRSRALGRTVTLEERIWLSSDLVPRWAKSQNSEDGSKVAQAVHPRLVPTIPLKKLTRR